MVMSSVSLTWLNNSIAVCLLMLTCFAINYSNHQLSMTHALVFVSWIIAFVILCNYTITIN